MNWGTGCHLLMKRLKFKTSGELLIVLEDMPQIDNKQNTKDVNMYMVGLRMSFHVGCLSTRFKMIMGWRCSCVDEHKPLTNHDMVAY